MDSKITPLSISVPITDKDTGNPTPYFQRLLQILLKEKAVTDDLAETAIQPADLTTALTALQVAIQAIIDALVLDDLVDVDTTTTPPTDGQALVWDDANSLWVPGDVASGGGSGVEGLATVSDYGTADTVQAAGLDGYFCPNNNNTLSNVATSSNNLSVTFTVTTAQTVTVSFILNLTRASGITTAAIKTTSGTTIWPTTKDAGRFYAVADGELNGQMIDITASIPVAPGTHTWVVQLAHALTLPTVTYHERSLSVIYKTTLSGVPAGATGTFRGALVTKAASQTAANFSVRTAIPWTAEQYDTDNIHDNTTNNTRLTVPPGVSYVELSGGVQLGNYTGTFANLIIWKNGAQIDASPSELSYGSSAGAVWLNIKSPVIAVNAGDYFELALEVSGDASIDVNKASSFFAMEIVAATTSTSSWGNWTDLSFGAPSGTAYTANETFTLAAGNVLEVEVELYRVENQSCEVKIEVGGNHYRLSAQSDSNLVWYRTAAALGATGAITSFEHTGLQKFKLYFATRAASSNRMYGIFNDYRFPVTSNFDDTTHNMLGSASIKIDVGTGGSVLRARARLV